MKQSIMNRLDELGKLEDGWLDGYGVKISIIDKIKEMYDDELPEPFIYPTIEGGLGFEWDMYAHSITADIEPNMKSRVRSYILPECKFQNEIEVDLSTKEGWRQMVHFVTDRSKCCRAGISDSEIGLERKMLPNGLERDYGVYRGRG